jgi:hypothetical protein
MREAHPPVVEEAEPAKPSNDRARGGKARRAVGAKPLSRQKTTRPVNRWLTGRHGAQDRTRTCDLRFTKTEDPISAAVI